MKKKLFRDILRGIAKGSPTINGIIEAVENWKVKRSLDVKKEVDNIINLPNEQPTETPVELPHSWLSIALQLATSATLIYLVLSNKLEVEKFVDLIFKFI